MEEKYFKSPDEWRSWLADNFDKSSGIWLVYYKKDSDKPTMNYEESIEEALCFGWIDSIIRKIDNEKFVRKYTPRKNTSKWSESNKTRVIRLIDQNRMADPGMAKVIIAKESGMWDKPDRPDIPSELPEEFKLALGKNKDANKNFYQLAQSYQKHYIGWISVAKKPETREKRIKESIRLLEKGEKLGMR